MGLRARQFRCALLGWVKFSSALGDFLGAAPREATVRIWPIPASGLTWPFVLVRLFNTIPVKRSTGVALLLQQTHGQILEPPIA